jgi:hypothetical protein
MPNALGVGIELGLVKAVFLLKAWQKNSGVRAIGSRNVLTISYRIFFEVAFNARILLKNTPETSLEEKSLCIKRCCIH